MDQPTIFTHGAGAFPLGATSYHVAGDTVCCEVAIGPSLHGVRLDPPDAHRFIVTVATANLHIRWLGRGLPRAGTLYQVESDPGGAGYRVCWWWHDQDGRLAGAEALAFLRSAGALRVCAACDRERIILPELETPICSSCGYYAQDAAHITL
jgi:hypothetical protein